MASVFDDLSKTCHPLDPALSYPGFCTGDGRTQACLEGRVTDALLGDDAG
eukprot:CAMPEP_0196663228 /NCGR_PEP_ID=MMETSP1086-20130531/52019_1 /TAXON_ID=77921 /ORGANISM="Cyanoptyche  gloeocystis , Strain SAG4.97" /LENGTH=49 /DNA_ID= /DNA_START= /DNA_END= /DNA_ORIENTATION=